MCECAGERSQAARNESGYADEFPRWPQQWGAGGCSRARSGCASEGSEAKYIRWDPKEIELFLGRRKPGETLVDVRSSTDVQIVCQNWVKGRKTHRDF